MFTRLDYSSALEYSIIRRYTNIVYYYYYLLMSFMGTIGNIMAGCGHEQLWESVYVKGSVVHMMSGHAIPEHCVLTL